MKTKLSLRMQIFSKKEYICMWLDSNPIVESLQSYLYV